MIVVKIPGSCFQFLDTTLNSLRHYFANDNNQFFFVKPMNFKIGRISQFLRTSERVLFETVSTVKFS